MKYHILIIHESLIRRYRALAMVYDSLTFFLVCASPKFQTNTTLRKPALLLSSGKEAPRLVGLLDRAILSRWVQ